MNTLIHADIFFYVTTIAVIILTFLVAVVLVYAVKVTRALSELAEKIRDEGGQIVETMAAVREKIEEEGLKAASFGKMVKGFFIGKSIFSAFKKKRSSRAAEEEGRGSEASARHRKSSAKAKEAKSSEDRDFEMGEQF